MLHNSEFLLNIIKYIWANFKSPFSSCRLWNNTNDIKKRNPYFVFFFRLIEFTSSFQIILMKLMCASSPCSSISSTFPTYGLSGMVSTQSLGLGTILVDCESSMTALDGSLFWSVFFSDASFLQFLVDVVSKHSRQPL